MNKRRRKLKEKKTTKKKMRGRKEGKGRKAERSERELRKEGTESLSINPYYGLITNKRIRKKKA